MTKESITISVAEAAKILGISRPTMYKLMHRADFPQLRVGRRMLIPVDDLRQWVSAQATRKEE